MLIVMEVRKDAQHTQQTQQAPALKPVRQLNRSTLEATSHTHRHTHTHTHTCLVRVTQYAYQRLEGIMQVDACRLAQDIVSIQEHTRLEEHCTCTKFCKLVQYCK